MRSSRRTSAARASGDAFVESRSLAVLAQYHLDAGEVEPAIPLLEESHRVGRERPGIPDRFSQVILVCRFALALALTGEAEAATRLLACADARFEDLEVAAERWVIRMNDRTRELIGSMVDGATAARAKDEGRKLTVDEAVTVALDLLRQTDRT